jgi:hypothetical protein
MLSLLDFPRASSPDERAAKPPCLGGREVSNVFHYAGRPTATKGGRMSLEATLRDYAAAGYPAVAIETPEEERIVALLLTLFDQRPAASIAAVGGLRDLRKASAIDARAVYPLAFAWAAGGQDRLLVVRDWQHICRQPAAYRPLLDALAACKAAGSLIVLLAPAWELPAELEHDVPVVRAPRPTREQLAAALDVVVSSVAGAKLDAGLRERLLDAASGLTLQEAESAFALAATHGFSPDIVEREKLSLIRQSGYMEISAPLPADRIGGVAGLRDYIATELLPAASDTELCPRGVLLVGVPGTGKSLAAKVISGLLGWPLLRLDIGRLKGSLVGESERQMRDALALVDAVAPAVLWLDEIEKGVGGYASSALTDGGTTLSMIGTLLTWMQEHTSRVLVVATCNDYHKLPPELTRAGRFDERFFVDLPVLSERREIAAIHLSRFGCRDAAAIETLATVSDGWTGAEIEQCVISAARRTQRRITADAIREAAAYIRPISRVRADEIRELRQWAADSLRPAGGDMPAPGAGDGRQRRRIAKEAPHV